MAGEGIVDRLVVAVDYVYDAVVPDTIEADFEGLIGLAGTLAAAMVGLAMSSAAAGDAAHDMGVQLGLSSEEVTAWTYAAGVSVDVLAQAFGTLDRNLAAAREGAGPAAEAFKWLRIDPREIENADDALFHIADRLKGIANEGDRAALRVALLGNAAGPKLAGLLAQGSAGIETMLKQAGRLGVTISTTDAQISDDFFSALGDLGEISAGLGRKIGFAVLPTIVKLTKGVRDWYLANDDLIGQQIDRVADGIGYALDQLQTPVGKAVAGALAIASAWGAAGAAKAMYTAVAASSPLVASLGSQVGAMAAATAAAGPWALAIAAAGIALDDFLVTAEGGDSILLDLGEAMGARGETQQAAAGLIDLLDAGTEAAWAFAGALEVGLGDAIDYLADKIPSLEPLIAPLRDLLDLDAAEIIGGTAEQFQRSARGLRLGARYLEGDESVQFRPGRGTGDIIDDFVTFSPLRPESAQSRPAVTVNVNGSSPEEVARMAGEAARREVEIQTLEALSAVGMPP